MTTRSTSDPTDTLARFLAAVRAGSITDALAFVQLTQKSVRNANSLHKDIRHLMYNLAGAKDDVEVLAISVGDDVDIGAIPRPTVKSQAMRDVPYRIEFGTPDGPLTVFGLARLICETEPFKPRTDGTWGVNIASLFRRSIVGGIER